MQTVDGSIGTAYPVAERQALVDHLHGTPVSDPYRWLEDPESPATRRWQAAQDELWQVTAAGWAGRARWNRRIAQLSSPDTITAPTWRGQWQFYERHGGDRALPVLCTTAPDGAERVLLDPLTLDPRATTTLDAWHVDPEGELVACQLSRTGSEQAELVVLDVATGRVVDGPIGGCRYAPVAWLPVARERAFYYVRVAEGDEAALRRIYRHRVGTPADTDDLLAPGDSPREPVSWGLGISPDGRWLAVSATRGADPGNDLWLTDLTAPGPPVLRAAQRGEPTTAAAAVGRDGRMYVATDRAAPRGRICVGDPARPAAQDWRELVAEDPEAVLTGLTILDGPALPRPLLLVGRTRHALGEIGIHDLATGRLLGEVPLPGPGSVGSLSARPEGGHEAWFSYTDAVTPPTIYRFDAVEGTTRAWSDPGPAPIPDLDAAQLTCRSADGTPVRVVVLARRGARPGLEGSGPRPTILYGYGGFGIPLTPTYSSYALAWVEAGGVFATAQVRGGGEEGADWHRAGALGGKQNAVDDFVAVAEHLIGTGWTAPDRLGICGESNGGLLVGAALTQRPDLFAAAVCSAPLMDMLRYELSGMGPSWRAEYGTAADPVQFGWLHGYSPYHRVRPGVAYPAVLLTTFAGDTRVDPLHARKMCAALQWASDSRDRPVLLRHEPDVGHGLRATDRAVGLAADMLAFFGEHTGLAPVTGIPDQASAR